MVKKKGIAMRVFKKVRNIVDMILTEIKKFIDNVILDIEQNNNPKLKPIKIDKNVNENKRGP